MHANFRSSSFCTYACSSGAGSGPRLWRLLDGEASLSWAAVGRFPVVAKRIAADCEKTIMHITVVGIPSCPSRRDLSPLEDKPVAFGGDGWYSLRKQLPTISHRIHGNDDSAPKFLLIVIGKPFRGYKVSPAATWRMGL